MTGTRALSMAFVMSSMDLSSPPGVSSSINNAAAFDSSASRIARWMKRALLGAMVPSPRMRNTGAASPAGGAASRATSGAAGAPTSAARTAAPLHHGLLLNLIMLDLTSSPARNQLWRATSPTGSLMLIDARDVFQGVDLVGRLVVTDAFDPRKPQRIPAGMPRAAGDGIERNLEYDLRLHQFHPAAVCDRVRAKPLGQRGDLRIGQPAVGLADGRQRLAIAHGEGDIAEHPGPLAVSLLCGHHHDIQRGQFFLQLHPLPPALAGLITALGAFHHQPFIPAGAGLAEADLQILRAGGHCGVRLLHRASQPQSAQPALAINERSIEQVLPVHVQQVEGEQHDRDVSDQLAGIFPTQPLLELRKGNGPPVPPGHDLSVDDVASGQGAQTALQLRK